MVQLATWTKPYRIGSSPAGRNVFLSPRWVAFTSTLGGGFPPLNTEWVWPFPLGGGGGSFWKGFRIIIYSKNGNGTALMTRTVNGADVGQTLTLNNDEPPSVPTVFTDLVNVEIFKFDKLAIRYTNSFGGSTAPKVNFISYFEFPDGFWGF